MLLAKDTGEIRDAQIAYVIYENNSSPYISHELIVLNNRKFEQWELTNGHLGYPHITTSIRRQKILSSFCFKEINFNFEVVGAVNKR